MLAVSFETPSLLASARASYEARDYQNVVALLGKLSHAELVATPDAGFMLIDAARRIGSRVDVEPPIEEVVNAARQQGNLPVLCDALNLQGVLLLERGHAQAAERAWCDLVIVATAADSAQYVARASNNLGVSALFTMRMETAIASFQRAIAAYLRLGYARGLAQSHQNLAIVYREMDHAQDAHAHFELAMTFARTADCTDDVARAEQELALLMLYNGEDMQGAADMVRNALDRFSELRQPAGTAEAMRVLGVIEMARGHREEAEISLSSALSIARDLTLKLLEAETLLALARLARLNQDAPTGYTLHQQATAIFQEMGAEPWGVQVNRRMEAVG